MQTFNNCYSFDIQDWDKFVINHPKLKAVSVSETEGIVDHAVAFSKLTDLEKLSLTIDCLYGK